MKAETLDEICVASLREAFEYAYNKGQRFDQQPDHERADEIKEKLKTALTALVGDIIGADLEPISHSDRHQTKPNFVNNEKKKQRQRAVTRGLLIEKNKSL